MFNVYFYKHRLTLISV